MTTPRTSRTQNKATVGAIDRDIRKEKGDREVGWGGGAIFLEEREGRKSEGKTRLGAGTMGRGQLERR